MKNLVGIDCSQREYKFILKSILTDALLAEKEGFEPSRQLPQPTPLAGEPLTATWVLLQMQRKTKNGGDGRIRTHGVFRLNGFQDRLLQPLGHISRCDMNPHALHAELL